MNVRHAKASDAPALVMLLAQMGYHMSEEKMQLRVAAFNVSSHRLLVAEENGAVIGAIAFGCYEQLRLPSPCCHIDTLVVDEAHRGKGIGKQLVALAEKYATEQGATMVELIAANHRRKDGTHAFYEALGYKDHVAFDYTYFAKE